MCRLGIKGYDDASHRQVLYELFAEVVVDAVHLVLSKVLTQLTTQLLEGLAVSPEGLLHDDTRPPTPAAPRSCELISNDAIISDNEFTCLPAWRMVCKLDKGVTTG